MAVYYHGSQTPGLKVLQPQVSPLSGAGRAVFLTGLPAMAVLYGVRHFEYTYGYRWTDGKPGGIYYMEYFPDALRKIYSGKRGWLYTCGEGEYEITEIPNERLSRTPVPVLDCREIPDLYAKLLDLESAGELEIVRYETLSEKTLAWIERAVTAEILEKGLLSADTSDTPMAAYLRKTYPESWRDAVKQNITDEIKKNH